MMKEKHLLDVLWEMVGCDYLSDMKTEKMRAKTFDAIGHIHKSDYSTAMWNETLSYILGKKIIVSSPKDVDAVIGMQDFTLKS